MAEDETSSGFCFVSLLRVTVTPGLNWGLNLYLDPNLHYYQLIVEYMYIIIIIITNQPTVKESCPDGYDTLSSRVELQPLTRVCTGSAHGSYRV